MKSTVGDFMDSLSHCSARMVPDADGNVIWRRVGTQAIFRRP